MFPRLPASGALGAASLPGACATAAESWLSVGAALTRLNEAEEARVAKMTEELVGMRMMTDIAGGI